MDFLQIFTSGSYYRDMKFLKIPLTPSGSEFMAFLKSDKLMMIERTAKYYIFLDTFCLKQPLVLKIPLSIFLNQRT